MGKKRLLWLSSVLLLLVLVALPLMVACAAPAPEAPAPEAPAPEAPAPEAPAVVKDTLVIGVPVLSPSLDQDTETHTMLTWMASSLWDYLYLYGRKPSPTAEGVRVLDWDKYEPRLAESWELSPDYKTLTVHLRKGVLSPWGNEFTTKDVAFSWKRSLAIMGIRSFFFGVMGMDSVDDMKIIDDYTFSFSADEPNFLLEICQALISCGYVDSTEILENADADDPWGSEVIAKRCPGYGPYYVEEYISGDKAVYLANPNYFLEPPYFKKLIFKVIPESASRVAMIKDGTIDIALELVPRELNSLKGTPGVRVITERGVWLTYLVLNDLVVPEFGDKKVRQAVNYAIDRDKIVDMAYFGLADPLESVYPRQRPGALDPEEFPYDYDIEKAKQALAESDYPDGFDVELYYLSDVDQHETAAIIVAEELAKIGINVTLRKTPIGTLSTLVIGHEVPFAINRDTPYAPDPNYCTYLYYQTGTAKGGDGLMNYTGFSDPEVDRMIREGATIMDKEERYQYYYDLQRLILEDAPLGFMVQEGFGVAIRDKLEGWNIDIGDYCRWEELSWRE